MERKIYWTVALVSVAILVATFFTTDRTTDKNDLPWHIEHPTPDAVRIFGLTLGQSNANEAEQRFREDAKPSLFKSPKGEMVAEVFFEQVDLAGLRSRIVLTIAVPEAELQGMFERGLRMSGTGGGKKITMTPDDIAHLRTLPISSLTYIPSIRLEEDTLMKRFGQPAQRLKEKDTGSVHWLYPQNGLDITLSDQEKPVFQYVPPREFDKLVRPLLASGKAISQ